MGLNLAASRFPLGKKQADAVKGRDMTAIRMTSAQVTEAQRLAREWQLKPP
jgi:hypothetical protein